MKIFSLIFVLLGFCSTAFAGLKEPKQDSPNFSASMDPKNEYSLKVSATVTPLGAYSSIGISVPVKLKVSCNEKPLGEDFFFYNRNLKNKAITLTVNISKFLAQCPSANPLVLLEPNGVELDVTNPFYTAVPFNRGLTFETIKNLRTNKSIQLVKTSAALADLGGSREAFYCLIQDYEPDILMSGVVEDMKNQYAKYYGSYAEETKIKCPSASKGALAANVAVCDADPTDISPFCLTYTRYLAVKEWYSISTDRLETIAGELDSTEIELKQEIDDVISSMNQEIEAKEAALTKKIAES